MLEMTGLIVALVALLGSNDFNTTDKSLTFVKNAFTNFISATVNGFDSDATFFLPPPSIPDVAYVLSRLVVSSVTGAVGNTGGTAPGGALTGVVGVPLLFFELVV